MDGLNDVIRSEIAPAVFKIAPILGGVLGTPLAGAAISLIANALGVDPDKIQDVANAVNGDPEAKNKLKVIEIDHANTLAALAAQNYQTEVNDRVNARSTAVLYKDFLRHMAYLVTFGFFGALILLFLPIPYNPNERELLSMLVGMLVSKWQTIIDFFFGSSRHIQGVRK